VAIDVERRGDVVRVNLTGRDRVFALKGGLEIPADRVTSIEVLPRREVPSGKGTLLRLPGTYIPGLIRHGSYGLGPNREFWAVYRQDEVLVISVHDWDYRRVVIATDNPAMDAVRLGKLV
jgi:hypothetical protein